MRNVFFIVGAGMLVTACASASPSPAPVMAERLESGPAPVAGLDWFLTEEPTETRLAYGLANSGDFRMALYCEPGAGRLGLMQAAEAPAALMVLESGGDMERLATTVEPAGVTDGTLLLAEVLPSVPVLQRFRTLGWLAIWQGEKREMLAGHPESRPSIDRFFTLCS